MSADICGSFAATIEMTMPSSSPRVRRHADVPRRRQLLAGFLPQKGPRMSLQLCFVNSDWYVRRVRASQGQRLCQSWLVTRKIIEWAPRKLKVRA